MKMLKYILFFIIGLIIIFLALGLFKPTVNYGHEITVNKPLQEAWYVSQDVTKYKQWLEGFKSMELISGEEAKVGSKYKVIVQPGEDQSEFEMTETIVSIKEFDHVTLHFDSKPMNFEQTISFNTSNGVTTIKSDSKVIGKNIISRAMFAAMEMLGGAFTSQETKNFEALKKLIEANTTDYAANPPKLVN